MKNLIILCGGKSAEHEVSFLSARSVIENLDASAFRPFVIGIDTKGETLSSDKVRSRLAITGKSEISYVDTDDWINYLRDANPAETVVFPVLHGPFGEDGTIQGMLEILGLPFVGASVAGSAVGMNKAHCKSILQAGGLPVLPWVVIDWSLWKRERSSVVKRTMKGFEFPVFVKPANMGSSIGISRVSDSEELDSAVDLAFDFDDFVLIEKGIEAREIEISVLGSFEPHASIPGEIVPGASFYDYSSKYLNDTSQLLIPAPLSEEKIEEFQGLALRAFKVLQLEGMARVDFLLDRRTDEGWINEPNTIPGFTRISMYPKLWDYSGVSFSELIHQLVKLAVDRHERRKRLKVDRQ